MKLLVTGGAGFIGSNYVRWVLANTDDTVTVYDALTYAGNRSSLRDMEESDPDRCRFVQGNVCDLDTVSHAVEGHDAVLHFAAESHVDRSIAGAEDFAMTNCVGTNSVMYACSRAGTPRIVHVSTDEVYGSVEQGYSTEADALDPRSPYSATKAGSDLIARAYHSTYGLPVMITRSSNNFGPYQYPEKVIPLFVTNLLEGRKAPLYGDGLNRRDWLYVGDNCAAIDTVLRAGAPGEIYNIGAGTELTNRALTDRLLALAGAGPEMVEYVDDRPGHDRRYAVDVVEGARPRMGAPAIARRGPRPDLQLVSRQPVVVGAAEGASRDLPVRILVTGSAGQLGTDLSRIITEDGHHQLVAVDRASLDVSDRDFVLGALAELRPDLVVHAAAWTAVDACEADPDRAWRVNALGCRHLADGAAAVGAHLVSVSTDYVFDGTSPRPYHEWDPTHPQSVYGQSKLGGETEVLRRHPGSAVVRTSWLCSPHGTNMVKTVLELGARTSRASRANLLRFVDDQRGCPTFTSDLAGMILELGVGKRSGIFHVTNQGPTSRYEFAREVLAFAGLDPAMVEPIATADLSPPRPAPRPANSVLDNAALRLSGVPLLPDHRGPLERTVKMLTG